MLSWAGVASLAFCFLKAPQPRRHHFDLFILSVQVAAQVVPPDNAIGVILLTLLVIPPIPRLITYLFPSPLPITAHPSFSHYHLPPSHFLLTPSRSPNAFTITL